MFTGLVTDIGRIARRSAGSDGATFTIETGLDTDDFEIGESIAVDGACLTVTAFDDDSFQIDASPETLDRTTLGDRKVGDGVHLERALRLADRLGGHLVTGHIDGVGTLIERRPDGNAILLTFETPDAVAPYLLEKGSIAVDGVSLTINTVDDDRFGVAIIPHTADKTLLADYATGRPVNLEADLVGKYVRKFVGSSADAGLTMQALKDNGFA